jgi:hypothetical protein
MEATRSTWRTALHSEPNRLRLDARLDALAPSVLARLLAHARTFPSNPDDLSGHLAACAADLAFDLAEDGRCREGRELARWALAHDPRDATAAHALAHALAEDGEHAGVDRFVGHWLDGYTASAPEHSHLVWHLGISLVRLGRPDRALRIYQERLDPASAPCTRLRDAAGLLWRLQVEAQLDGRYLPLPWTAVRDLAVRTIRAAPDGTSGTPGMDGVDAIHAAMALAAVDDTDEAARLERCLWLQAQRGDTTAKTVTLPFVQGILAFGAGRYAAAERLIAPVAGQLRRLGASNGQSTNVLVTLEAARRHRLPRYPLAERRYRPWPSLADAA